MTKKIFLFLTILFCVNLAFGKSVEKFENDIDQEEKDALDLVNSMNDPLNHDKNLETIAEWQYTSNITDENERNKIEVLAETAKRGKERILKLRKFTNYKNFKNEDLKRQIKLLWSMGYSAMSEEDYREILTAVSNMESNFAKIKICSYEDRTKCDLSLDPEIESIIKDSRDPEELKYYWVEFYNKAGAPVREHFNKYVALTHKAALLNNFTNNAEVWLNEYDDPNFEKNLEDIFEELKPFYHQIHAYVRYQLRKKYGDDVVSEKGPIPMHLLGNMWAQTWDQVSDFMLPYPDKPSIDVTDEMVRQGYTPVKMFEKGDEFFQSMNMTKLPQVFWDKSILEKPKDGRDLVCHASAWDFFLIDDVRIKQCTTVNMEQFFTVHHELGHIQYFLQYQHLPHKFRDGANPGFHEAVGDVLSLSVSTPKHLQSVGLLKDYEFNDEARLNGLFLTSLRKIVFLPFAFTMDKYRWSIFRGELKPEEQNCAFWKLREEFSGIEPPVVRSEADFDAPAKYHISSDVEYLRYLVADIVQFQFLKAACIKAGQYVPGNPDLPLDNCDIYGSAVAGNAFKEMLQLGSSKPWPDAMEVFTGERKMTASAILEYFEPLRAWLEQENKKNKAYVGWEPSDKCQ